MQERPLTEHIKEMRNASELLIPYTYPAVDFDTEYTVLPLKCRTVVVDGYELALNYSIANYKKYFIESVQIQSVYTPFLPFLLVCNIAKSFLGNKHLSYVDFVRNHKKIYCWTVRKRKGSAISPSKKSQPASYEGFEYNILNPGSVNLYEM